MNKLQIWLGKSLALLMILSACTTAEVNAPTSPSSSPAAPSSSARSSAGETRNQTSLTLDDVQNADSARPNPSSTEAAAALPPSASATQANAEVDPRFTVSSEMVWQVKPQGQAEPVSHLIGTVHAPFAEGYSPPDSFWQRIEQSQALYVEMDLEQAESPAFLNQLLSQALDPEQNLLAELGQENFAKLAERMQAKGVPVQILPQMQPWFIGVNLSGVPEGASANVDTIMDSLIRQRAQQAQRSIRFLETPQEQIGQIQAVSRAEHLRLIQEALEENAEARLEDFAKVFTLYNQDKPELWEAEIQSAQEQSAEYFQKVVADRNLKWAKTLTEVMKTEAVSVAVGNLHMFGETGLIAQLEAAGFDVRFIAE